MVPIQVLKNFTRISASRHPRQCFPLKRLETSHLFQQGCILDNGPDTGA